MISHSPIESSPYWPELPKLEDWQPTLDTVHMWTQVLGKVRLTLGPFLNHSWGNALYISSRGITTSPIPYDEGNFTIDLDFTDHKFIARRSDGRVASFPLRPISVAEFYGAAMNALAEIGVSVEINPKPVEVPEAIPFPEDQKHASYDADAVHRFWLALVAIERVFAKFRANFVGKASPVHLFWGAFDLATTRFSGRRAPKHPGGAPNCPVWVMEEAYSHELASAGFWAGPGLGEAAFYAYAYPAPEGYSAAQVSPAEAYYHTGLGEFILPYEAVRTAEDPQAKLLEFLQSTYVAAAELGAWPRADLERAPA